MAETTIGSLIVQLEANTAKLDEQIKTTKAHFTGLSDTIGTVKNALLGLGAFEGLKAMVEVAAENEKALALLKSQLKATGEAAHLSAGQLTEMADSLQGSTTYSHEQIEQVESQMLAFTNITGEQFKKTLVAVLDFATVTGRDASEAVRTLGQAINNPISSMGRLTQAGISLDQATKDQIKSLQEHGHLIDAQNLLLAMLEKSYGGAAAAARDTLGGALQGLKHDAEDLLEGDGGLNSVTDGVKALDATLRDPEVKAGIASLVAGILDLVGAVSKAAAAFAGLGTSIGEFFAKAQGYTGGFDDQVSQLNEKIGETRNQLKLAQESAGPQGSPMVDQLMAQLADYQAKLVQVQEAQRRIITQSDTATGRAALPGLGSLTGDLAFKKDAGTAKIDSLPGINPFGVTGEKSNPYQQMLSDQQEVVKIWQQNDPAKMLQEEIAKTQALVGTVANGEIFTAEDAQKHIEDLKASFQSNTDQMTTFADQAARNIQDLLGKDLFQGFHDGLRGMAESFTQMLLKMIMQIESAQLLNHLFGGFDGSGKGSGQAGLASLIDHGLSSMFGSSGTTGHAGGGVVSAGDFSPVNENGPELYNDTSGRQWLLAGSDGTVTPAGNFGAGAAGGGHQVNIDARGAGPTEVAKLYALRAEILNTARYDVEHRLQRGGWPTSRRTG